jgi:hypothetical protein
MMVKIPQDPLAILQQTRGGGKGVYNQILARTLHLYLDFEPRVALVTVLSQRGGLGFCALLLTNLGTTHLQTLVSIPSRCF